MNSFIDVYIVIRKYLEPTTMMRSAQVNRNLCVGRKSVPLLRREGTSSEDGSVPRLLVSDPLLQWSLRRPGTPRRLWSGSSRPKGS